MGSAQVIIPYQPLNASVAVDDHVRFSWKKRPNVALYTLQVSSDNLFTAPQEFTTSSAEYTVWGLNPVANYWWRVKADNGPWTAVRTFQTTDLHNWPGLVLWFRADSAIIHLDDLVSQWQNLAGAGTLATQSSASLKPAYLSKAYNDLPAVRFGKTGAAGEATYLSFPPQPFPGGVFTMLSVWDMISNTVVLQYPLGGTTQGIFAGGTAAGLNNTGSFDGVTTYQATGATNLFLNQTTLKRNAVWRNGATLTASGTAINSLTLSTLGTRADLPATLFFNAILPEVFLFQSNLSDSLRILGQNYLLSKYARPVQIPYDTNVCAPNLLLTLPGGTDEYSAILWSTGATTPTVNIIANGTYWVRGTSRLGGYITTDTIRVRGILPLPQITPAGHQYFCFNQDTLEFNKVTNAAGIVYTWSDGSSADSLLVPSGDKIYLTAYDSVAGCLLTSDTTYVTHKTKADFNNSAVCPARDVQFQDLSLDLTNDTITSWAWNFGDPGTVADTSTDTNGVWNYAQSGTYSVYLKVVASDGCADSIAKNVTVKPTATANFNWQGACYGKPTQFFDQSLPEAGTQVTGYQWFFGPGISSSFVNPAVTFDTANVYPVTLVAYTASGCTDTVQLQVPVNKGVNAAFSISDSLCAGQPVDALDESQGISDNITQWIWRFGNNPPISGQAPQFAFQGTGNRVVRLTTTTAAGCADSVQKNVFVRPSPTAAFSFAANGGTPPFTPVLNNQSTGADFTVWDYGNGFTDIAVTPILPPFADTGTYTVTLAVANSEGCTDTVSHTFVVFTGDRTLQLIQATCVLDEDGFVNYTARVLNKGALEVNGITFGGNLNYNSVLREKWEGTLLSGQVMEYVFNSSAKYFTSADFCCVRIEDFNDTLTVQAPDNEICKPLTDQAWFSDAYPTPTDGIITIDHTLPFADVLSATLCGVDGKVIRPLFSEQSAAAGFGSHTADISDLRSGLYVVRFTYRDKNYSVKVLKK